MQVPHPFCATQGQVCLHSCSGSYLLQTQADHSLTFSRDNLYGYPSAVTGTPSPPRVLNCPAVPSFPPRWDDLVVLRWAASSQSAHLPPWPPHARHSPPMPRRAAAFLRRLHFCLHTPETCFSFHGRIGWAIHCNRRHFPEELSQGQFLFFQYMCSWLVLLKSRIFLALLNWIYFFSWPEDFS